MRDHALPTAILLLAAILASALPTASAQETVEVDIETHSDGSDFWFECSGAPAVCGDGRNPTLTLEAGRTYAFHVTNPSNTAHDFNLGGAIGETTALLDPGAEATLTVTVPAGASGDAEYWCNPHRSSGMKGALVFASADDGGNDNGSPGPGALGLAGALLGALALARRARP